MDDKTPNKLSMEVDPEAINAIVRETINSQIAVALQKEGVDFSSAIVKAVLDARVDRDGKIIQRGSHSYDRATTSWFDHQLQDMIRDCAKTAMMDFIKSQSPKIEKAMFAAFKKRTPQIVKAMTDGTILAFTRKWAFNFDLKLRPNED